MSAERDNDTPGWRTWRLWIEEVKARPASIRWMCPEPDCRGEFPSAAYIGDHLVQAHNWTESELAGWWGK